MSRDKQRAYCISKESVEKLFPKQDIDILGYESPIKLLMGQMRIEQEIGICKAIQEQGITVDKDELIKALQYDRGQYDKGYINGYNRKASEVAREIFEEIEKALEQAKEIADVRIRELAPHTYKVMREAGKLYHKHDSNAIDELKKKYTEDGE